VVDGYEGAAGSFTLTVETTPYFVPPAICDLIRDVTGTFFTGNTCDGYNNITTSDCGSYPERGREHYYEIQVPVGCTFTASAAFDFEDGAMWLLDSCAAGYACLGYADITYEGEPEVVIYNNDTPAPQSLILVVDSYGDQFLRVLSARVHLRLRRRDRDRLVRRRQGTVSIGVPPGMRETMDREPILPSDC
jgi:hypothetical protein